MRMRRQMAVAEMARRKVAVDHGKKAKQIRMRASESLLFSLVWPLQVQLVNAPETCAGMR